jgi:hypothetical protein
MGAKGIRAGRPTYIQAVFCSVPSPIVVNERKKREFHCKEMGCQGCSTIEIWAGLGSQNGQILEDALAKSLEAPPVYISSKLLKTLADDLDTVLHVDKPI